MGKCEVTWDEYDIWNHNLDIKKRKVLKTVATEQDLASDAVTRPTKPYTDMTFGMGHDGYPAICMTQLAAKTVARRCEDRPLLPPADRSRMGHACRAGTTTAYSFGG